MIGITTLSLSLLSFAATADEVLAEAEAIVKESRPAAVSLRPAITLAVPKNLLAGRSGKGSLNSRDLYLAFGADGETVSAWTQGRTVTERPYQGKYTVTGGTVRFVLGPSTFSGRISDRGISGQRERTDGISDSWDLNFDE